MKGVIGIRRETKSIWERRVAFTPEHVKILQEEGIQVLIQSCNLRCFSDQEYIAAGAQISEDLSNANVIFGIKEIGMEYFTPRKAYVFFSHIRKAQPYNMPLMDVMLDNQIQVIDYELISEVEYPYPRLIAFGEYAGSVGVIDFLQGLGKYLLYQRLGTPFLYQSFAYCYPWLEDAKASLRKVGSQLQANRLPTEISPLIFGVTGTGRCSIGAQNMLRCLPHEYITPEELEELDLDTCRNDLIYIVVFGISYLYQRKEGGGFDREEFRNDPQVYRGVFAERYLRKLSVVVQCIYWENSCPMVISEEDMAYGERLLGICDVSCDLLGGIEACKKFTCPDAPFFLYNKKSHRMFELNEKFINNSVLMHTMDFLPCELAKDSSKHFGDKLLPFARTLALADYSLPLEEQGLGKILENATMMLHGKLTPKYEYIHRLRESTIQQKSASAEQMICDLVQNNNVLISDLENVKYGQSLSEESKQAILKIAEILRVNK